MKKTGSSFLLPRISHFFKKKADNPVEEIDWALEFRIGLMDLIENAKASVEIQGDYADSIKYMITAFLQQTNEFACASRYWHTLKPFLEDCRKEFS